MGDNAAAVWRRIAPHLPADGLVPAAVLQSLFAMLQPQAVVEKFRRLHDKGMTPERLQHFARVEQWLNDGVDIAQPVMREIIGDWYGRNLPMRGGWRAGAAMVRPRALDLPALIAVPEQDHIVPPAAALALARLLPRAESRVVPLGHIGMIVSRRARTLVWRGFADWIKQHHKTG